MLKVQCVSKTERKTNTKSGGEGSRSVRSWQESLNSFSLQNPLHVSETITIILHPNTAKCNPTQHHIEPLQTALAPDYICVFPSLSVVAVLVCVHLHNKASVGVKESSTESLAAVIGRIQGRPSVLQPFTHPAQPLLSGYPHCPPRNKATSDSHPAPIFFPDPMGMDSPVISPACEANLPQRSMEMRPLWDRPLRFGRCCK